MLIFQILASFFILFAMQRILTRYKQARVPKSEVFIWLFFWFLVAIAVWWPRGTDIIANAVGISRGYELVVAISLALLFFMAFKLFTHVHQLHGQMTDLVRKLAIQQHEEGEEKRNEYETN